MFEAKVPKELHRRMFELTLALYRVTDFFPQGEVLRRSLREKGNEIFGGVTEYGHSRDFEQEAIALLARIEAIRGYLNIARSMGFVRPINLTVLEREYSFLTKFFEKELEIFHSQKQTKAESVQRETEKNIVAEINAELEEVHTLDEYVPTPEPADVIPRVVRDDSIGQALQKPQNSVVWGFEPKDMSNRFVEQQTIPEVPKKFESRTAQNKNISHSVKSDPISDRQRKIIEHLKVSSQAKISDLYLYFNGISTKTIQRDLQDLVEKNVLKKEGEKRWTTYSINS